MAVSYFTVVGGLASVILSVLLGFRMTMLIALTVYLVALSMFSRLQRAETDRVVVAAALINPRVSARRIA